MRSLRTRLLALWGLSTLSSLVLGVLLLDLYHQSAEAQVGRSRVVLAQACDLIRDGYEFYVAGWNEPIVPDPATGQDLLAVVETALMRRPGVEGGLWAAGSGSLAYAYPTYEGSGPKTDLPAAESEQIAAVNAAARTENRGVDRTVATRSQTLLMAACPLEGPIPGLTGWAMTRVQASGPAQSVRSGLALLLLLLVATTVLLGRTLLVWGRQLRGIAAVLGGAGTGDAGGGLPAVPRSGERELDRVVDALNLAGRRLAAARREADGLASRVARSERLAGLGRVAAGVAHEIRNPLAAARLQGENALAGDDRRRRDGIRDMLEQLDRLDGLVSELLAMTQRVHPVPVPTPLLPFLRAVADRHAGALAERNLALRVAAAADTVPFDPVVVGRILDNLLTNAVRHAAPGGRVSLSVEAGAGGVILAVADDGPGVPADMADRLFEPFVTGRADGTGLGLAIARELADAHGGRLLLRNRGGGGALTEFALELPA